MRKNLTLNALGIILIISLLGAGFYYVNYQNESTKITEQSQTDYQQAVDNLDKIQIQQKIKEFEKEIKGLVNLYSDQIKNNDKIIDYIKNLNQTDKLLNNQINRTQEQLTNEIVRPSYDYLKSVTVYIRGEIPQKVLEDKSIRIRQAWVGTGVILKITDTETYILTNNHVTGKGENAEDEVKLSVKEGDTQIEATVVAQNPYLDAAIIKIKGKLTDKTSIKGTNNNYKEQDRIYSNGNYLAFENIYSEGTVAGKEPSSEGEDNVDLLLVNLPSLYGNSGSGIFNKDGELIGLLFAGNMYNMFCMDTAKALCVPYKLIKEFVEQNIGGF